MAKRSSEQSIGHCGRRVSRLAAVTASATVALLPSVHAQTPATTQEARALEEIVVTAQRRVEDLQDVPISISVLGGDDLDEWNASVTEALGRVPGVATTIAAQGGTTQLVVRGVTAGDAIFSGSSPIAYYLDSVPFGLVKSAIAPDSNAFDLDRIEVLRGPQGTLYGASALNGVVRVLTRSANLEDFELKARTSLSTTERDGGENYRGDLAVNVPIIPGKLAVRGVVGDEHLSGWIDRQNKSGINDADLRNYRLRVKAQPTEAFSVDLSAWRSENAYGGKSTSLDDGTITATQPEPIDIDYSAYGMTLEYSTDAFAVSSRTSYLDYENGSFLDLGPLGAPDITMLTDFDSQIFAEELVVSSNTTGAWEWSFGGFYREGKDGLFQDFPAAPGAFYVDYEDRSESSAVFGEISRRFLDDKLKWTVGLRYFEDDVLHREKSSDPNLPARPLHREGDSFHATSPRLVLSWYPSKDLTAYASYAEGFRSGFPQNANIAMSARGFPSLRPDELQNYELGVKGTVLDGRVFFDTAVYFIDWDSVQQTLTVDSQGTQVSALINGATASGVGFDLGVAVEAADDLSLSLGFSWNDLTFDDPSFSEGVLLFDRGDRPNVSPEYTVSGALQYGFALGGSGYRGRLSASANYISEQSTRTIWAGSRVIGIGDELLVGRTSLAIDAPEHWSASVYVDNVTDEDGTSVVTLQPIPELDVRLRPRTIGVQFELSF